MRNKNTNHLDNWKALQKKKGKPNESDKDLHKIWEHSRSYGQDFQPDVEAGLANLKIRIAHTPHTAKRIQMRQWLRMAAAVLVIGLASIITYQHFSTNNTPIAWIEVQTTNDEQRAIILPDGSEVTLNEGSHLYYAADINTANKRLVRLKGEAFFSVNRRPEQAFIISTTNAEIEVLGTSFNVRAYSNENQTEVEVSTGRVAFRDALQQQETILYANEAAILNNKNHINTLVAPALNRIAWKTGVLSFKETEIQTAFPLIARYYGIKFKGLDQLKNGCSISGNWKNDSLKDVFVIIESLTGLKIDQISNDVYQVKGSCD